MGTEIEGVSYCSRLTTRATTKNGGEFLQEKEEAPYNLFSDIMPRYYFGTDFSTFLASSDNAILGELEKASTFRHEHTQTYAWLEQIANLKHTFRHQQGRL